ncbi:MAG: glycosyltransferase [Clostridia bacterium]|nr:glycosyltransferase [Clostridia bacterium]
MKFTVCIPLYNEISTAENTARELTAAAEKYCEKRAGTEYELIFSDDGSADGCADAVPDAIDGAVHGIIKKVGTPVNMGKGAAIRRAVGASTGDVVLYTDCDLAYGTDVIGEALDAIAESGVDVLVGSRAIHPRGYEGYTFLRRLASKVYLKILTVFAGFRLSDSQCGFKLFRGDAARSIFSLCETNGWAFDFEVLMIAKKMGLTFGEHPVMIVNHRESRIRVFSDSFKMLREIFRIKKRVRKLKI